jgi:hypothetical protein
VIKNNEANLMRHAGPGLMATSSGTRIKVPNPDVRIVDAGYAGAFFQLGVFKYPVPR